MSINLTNEYRCIYYSIYPHFPRTCSYGRFLLHGSGTSLFPSIFLLRTYTQISNTAQGRVILHVTPLSARSVKNLWVPPRWMTPIFVTCDVLAFLIQVFGATSAVSKVSKTAQRGYNVMKVGLVIQLICFGFFLVVSLRFHMISKKFQSLSPDTKWKKLLMAINIASALIFVSLVFVFHFSLFFLVHAL